MENTIKKAFVLFPLLVIMLCAYFAASGTNNVVRVWLSGKMSTGADAEEQKARAKAQATKPKASQKRTDSELTLNPMTGQQISKDDAAGLTEAEVAQTAAMLAKAQDSDPLALAREIDCGEDVLSGTPCESAGDRYGYLIGTLVSSDPRESSARIMTKDKVSKSFELNNSLSSSGAEGGASSAKVAKICRRKMYIEEGKKLYCITSEADSKTLAERGAPAEEAAAPPADGEGIKEVSETEFQIDRNALDSALGSLDKLATDARIVPHFQGGKSVGFRMYAIKPGSLFAKVGLKNGDIIQRINGMDINSPEKALEIYTKLKEAKHISIDLQRRGKPMSVEYTIF